MKTICSIALPYNHGNKEINMRFCSIFGRKIKASSQQSVCESVHMGKAREVWMAICENPTQTIFSLLSKLNKVHLNCFYDLGLRSNFTVLIYFKSLPSQSAVSSGLIRTGPFGCAVVSFCDLIQQVRSTAPRSPNTETAHTGLVSKLQWAVVDSG